jgi:hypothetical protein
VHGVKLHGKTSRPDTESTSRLFSADDILDLQSFANKLWVRSDEFSSFLRDQIKAETEEPLSAYIATKTNGEKLAIALAKALNRLLLMSDFALKAPVEKVSLSPEVAALRRMDPEKLLIELNRTLLEDVYPLELRRLPELDSFSHRIRGQAVELEDPEKLTLRQIWSILTSLPVKFCVSAVVGLVSLVTLAFALGKQHGSEPAPGTKFEGYYQEVATDHFPAGDVCPKSETGTFFVYQDVQGLLHAVEISENALYTTSRGSVSDTRCGDDPSDKKVCVYTAEWTFEEKPNSRTSTSVSMHGKCERRLNLDSLLIGGSDLEPALRQKVDDFRKRIANDYRWADCDLTWSANETIMRTCWFNDRVNEPVTTTFRLLQRSR